MAQESTQQVAPQTYREPSQETLQEPSQEVADAGAAFAGLVAVMDVLRSPGGCPWDAEQTHASLAPYAIEEAYEVADAAERGDLDHLRDELGDLLLQVVFHARVATEHPTTPFDVVDVIDGLVGKLRRRHPHVFGDMVVAGAAEVSENWERIKTAERDGRTALGTATGVPLALPALVRAQKIASLSRRAGLEAPAEAAEHAAATAPDGARDLGVRLLSIVVDAEAHGIDAEAALRAATRDLETRLRERVVTVQRDPAPWAQGPEEHPPAPPE